MIRLAFNLVKIAVFSIVVLLIGQIPVGQKRISEHVRDITASPTVQKPVNWIAHKFDFVSNGGVAPVDPNNDPNKIQHNNNPASNSPTDQSSAERSRLSGLLKRPK